MWGWGITDPRPGARWGSAGKEPVGRRDGGCDRHVRRLTGANPVMAPGRGEHVGEGKGARRNSPRALRKRKLARPLLDGSQWGIWKKPESKFATWARANLWLGRQGRARCPGPPKPETLPVSPCRYRRQVGEDRGDWLTRWKAADSGSV